MIHIPFIGLDCDTFPPTSQALEDPNGLLAGGGDLNPETLISAYRRGIFPWFDDDQPILWWSPAPRAIFYPDQFQPSKSLKKVLRKQTFKITMDTVFSEVIVACSKPRANGDGTWITKDMVNAYIRLHKLGYAHSIEAWSDNLLVGGLYGICLGSVFFGESMFSSQSNASKAAFCYLVGFCKGQNIELIDCQVENPHLTSLGATNISREVFERHLSRLIPDDLSLKLHSGNWSSVK
ncbi:MAG: leucyl/phenylalanyl-tRNA--protein transferase [Moraxellaceae bacterium]|nr:MAG: leucyl/phenylalanyl-tRNA--protein transferase [Moraxellaceae bacterium]